MTFKSFQTHINCFKRDEKAHEHKNQPINIFNKTQKILCMQRVLVQGEKVF